MIKIILFFICILSGTVALSQKKISVSVINPCQKNWKYFASKDTIEGNVIYYETSGDCGYFVTASLTLVVTTIKDTIRVLQFCDNRNNFKYFQKVKVLPCRITKKRAGLIPIDEKNDCKIKKTYYSKIIAV